MKLPLIARSGYYRGLLVVSKRDRVIDNREREILIQIGQVFDFDRRFCEVTIGELLSNTHISRRAVVFSDEAIKGCFFRDALRVAHSDGCIHPKELSWLRQASHANGMSDEWLDAIVREFQERLDARDLGGPLEIQKHI